MVMVGTDTECREIWGGEQCESALVHLQTGPAAAQHRAHESQINESTIENPAGPGSSSSSNTSRPFCEFHFCLVCAPSARAAARSAEDKLKIVTNVRAGAKFSADTNILWRF